MLFSLLEFDTDWPGDSAPLELTRTIHRHDLSARHESRLIPVQWAIRKHELFNRAFPELKPKINGPDFSFNAQIEKFRINVKDIKANI